MSGTIEEEKHRLRREWKKGTKCGACGQRVHLAHRKLNSGMARCLVRMYRVHGTAWQDKTVTLKGYSTSARDESLLRFWGLLEEDQRTREDGGHAGWWRVTEKGRQFIAREITVYSHIWHFDTKCYGIDGKQITIDDALGKHFNLDELLHGGG